MLDVVTTCFPAHPMLPCVCFQQCECVLVCWESRQPAPPTHCRVKSFKSWGSETEEARKTQVFCPSGAREKFRTTKLGIVAFCIMYFYSRPLLFPANAPSEDSSTIIIKSGIYVSSAVPFYVCHILLLY